MDKDSGTVIKNFLKQLHEKLNQKVKGRMTEEKILQQNLKFFDISKKGALDFDQFAKGIEKTGCFMLQADLKIVFEYYDVDKSGTLDIDEMIPIMIEGKRPQPKPIAALQPKNPRAEEMMENLRRKLKERGTRGMVGLGRLFRNIDDNNSRSLDINEFKKAMKELKIVTDESEIEILFKSFDKDKSGDINYDEFIREIQGPLNELRRNLVEKAFCTLDHDGNKIIELPEIKRTYNADKHPAVVANRKTVDQVMEEFMETFEIHHNTQHSIRPDHKITLEEFIEYYTNVSSSIDNDEYFELMMNNSWGLDKKPEIKAPKEEKRGEYGIGESKMWASKESGESPFGGISHGEARSQIVSGKVNTESAPYFQEAKHSVQVSGKVNQVTYNIFGGDPAVDTLAKGKQSVAVSGRVNEMSKEFVLGTPGYIDPDPKQLPKESQPVINKAQMSAAGGSKLLAKKPEEELKVGTPVDKKEETKKEEIKIIQVDKEQFTQDENKRFTDKQKLLMQKLRKSLERRGNMGVAGLSRQFRIYDKDKSGDLIRSEFGRAIMDFRLGLEEDEVDELLKAFDSDKDGKISINEMWRGIVGKMNPRRAALAKQAFDLLDINSNGEIEMWEIAERYDASKHKDVLSGKKTKEEVLDDFLNVFQIQLNTKQGRRADTKITREEFDEYYNNISSLIDNDEYFALMMENSWKLSTAKKAVPKQPAPAPTPSELDSQPDMKGEELITHFRKIIAGRGVRGILSLRRLFKIIDDDHSLDLNMPEFTKAMGDFKVKLSKKNTETLFNVFDRNKNGTIDFDEFLRYSRGEMNESRKRVVKQVFDKFDKDGNGVINIDDLKGVYTADKHPDVLSGKKTEDDILLEFLDTFEEHHSISDPSGKDRIIKFEEFVEYYNNISCSIDNDEHFSLLLTNAWNLDEKTYAKGWTDK